MNHHLPALLLLAFFATGPALAQRDDPAYLESLAEDRFAADDLEQAATLYRRLADVLEPATDKIRVLMIVANLEHALGRDADAIRTLTEVLLLDPDYVFRPELYGESFRDVFLNAQKRAQTERATLAQSHIRRGIDALRGRDYDRARGELERGLGYLPNHPEGLYNLALANLSDGREEEAIAGFQKLLALPEARIDADIRALAMVNLGFLYNRRQLYQEAAAVLEAAVAIDPRQATAWSNLGTARRSLGDKPRAAAAYRKAHELAPDDPATIKHLALAYLDLGDPTSASTLLATATARHPDDARMWLYYGMAQLGLGQGALAARSLENAIRLDPGNASGTAADAAMHLARHHYQTGDARALLTQAERVIAWRPELAAARVYQGLAQQKLGQLQAARASFEQALRLDPTQAGTHNNLGDVYTKLGLYDEAITAFERALELDPGLASARANLAEVRRVKAAGG